MEIYGFIIDLIWLDKILKHKNKAFISIKKNTLTWILVYKDKKNLKVVKKNDLLNKDKILNEEENNIVENYLFKVY